MKQGNDYPVILVHGFLCWGEDEALNKVLPLFGMWNGNARKAIRSMGIQCETPSVGPFSSMWDRACLLYAYIKGGRVDYGKVHAEKYGHDRYGDTYPGVVPNWGELDEKGKMEKVHIIGHSFGGPTIRTLMNLLAEGDEEERNGTDPDDLSPLFTGGKSEWVRSITTLAATHTGVTLPDAVRPLIYPISLAVYGLGNLVSGTPIAKLYQFHLDRFGISNTGKHIKFNGKDVNRLAKMKEDNIFYELSTEGGAKATAGFQPYDTTYYFSFHGRRTKSFDFGPIHGEIPTKPMWFPFKLLSPFEGFYRDQDHGPEWQPNDGIVNCISARYPAGEPHEPYLKVEACKPGIWYFFPAEDKDHTSYMGVGERGRYNDFMKSLAERCLALPE